jgi:hypothetical protein
VKLYAIKDRDIYDKITVDIANSPGCYILCSHEDNRFRQINRVLDVDLAGVLYIGFGTSLRNRIASLRNALCAASNRDGYSGKSAHGCGHKYNARFQKIFPFESLKVTLYPVSTNEEAWELEGQLLVEYENQFGEAPPFNEGRPKAKRLG